jgi:hemerythrin-like domain-containing protein
MTLRQTIQAAPEKTAELITKLAGTSNQAVKTREGLFAQLSDELVRYIEIEEQHLLPLLRKHPETKDLATDALKGNKDLRASLAKLSDLPKDNDAFLAELADLNKGFQQHVRNERKELLPAVIKALSDEEAEAVVTNIEGAVADAEQAKRDAKRDEAAQAKRQAEEAEQAAEAQRAEVRAQKAAERDAKREEAVQAKRQAEEAEQAAQAQRAAVRAQKAAERSAREAAEKVVDTIERGAASVQDSARQVTANLTERAQRATSEARAALTVYSESTREIAEGLQAVRASSSVSREAASEVYTACMEWAEKATRTNAELSQQLLQCRSVTQVAEVQRQFVTSALRNWMESRAKVLEIAQHSSRQALRPLDGRLNDAA